MTEENILSQNTSSDDIKLTFLDSLKKRLGFIEGVLDVCNLKAKLVHARAEDGGRDKDLRETFDFATARAVAPLNILAEYCLPFVKVGGRFVALKGSNEETESFKGAIEKLGGELEESVSYKLPNGDKRCLVIIKKISQTPTIFPRKPKKITCKIFFAKVMSLMGWDPRYRYKILGKLIRTKEDSIFVFDLSSAEAYQNRVKGDSGTSKAPHYPEEWKNQFGIPATEHQDIQQISIFDDYTVFKIERSEENGARKDTKEDVDELGEPASDNSGSEEAAYPDPQ